MSNYRNSGVLCHISSLPGPYGIGNFGKEAYNFVRFLANSKQRLWQLLPLVPLGSGNCPYNSNASYAGNPLFIDPDGLYEKGLLKREDLDLLEPLKTKNVNYAKAYELNERILRKAFANFMNIKSPIKRIVLDSFAFEAGSWVEDYALYMALKKANNGKPWHDWDRDLATRKPEALSKVANELGDEVKYHKFVQYMFYKQWSDLKRYANEYGIQIVGDIPLYVAADSVEVWANPKAFQLNPEGTHPAKVSGVPPDFFSADGQLWGTPVYNWEYLEKTNFQWWVDRFKRNLELYDIVRIDHFRGLAGYYAVPYGHPNARYGEWFGAPGHKMLNAVKQVWPHMPFIAEDLGAIDDSVIRLRDDYNLPSMKILQFGLPTGYNEHTPHTYNYNTWVYTGTHDNDNTAGWYKGLDGHRRRQLRKYLNISRWEVHWDVSWEMMRMAWSTVSKTAIAPMQDLLRLGTDARMNIPGVADNNWEWRLASTDLRDEISSKLRGMTELYQRFM